MDNSNCKSCHNTIQSTDIFCSHCGGKIINKRLSIKGIWTEFIGPFFGWDNKFWKTISDLITKPQMVVEAYISGARKKYFQPFSFIILYATIALLFYKLLPLPNINKHVNTIILGENNEIQSKNAINIGTEILTFVYSYYNFIIIISIPLLALLSQLTYRKQKNNFPEHIIIQSYIQSIIGYFALLSQVIMINILDMKYEYYLNIYTIITLSYINYYFWKAYSLSLRQLILSNFRFLFLLVILTILLFLFGILYGYLNSSLSN